MPLQACQRHGAAPGVPASWERRGQHDALPHPCPLPPSADHLFLRLPKPQGHRHPPHRTTTGYHRQQDANGNLCLQEPRSPPTPRPLNGTSRQGGQRGIDRISPLDTCQAMPTRGKRAHYRDLPPSQTSQDLFSTISHQGPCAVSTSNTPTLNTSTTLHGPTSTSPSSPPEPASCSI